MTPPETITTEMTFVDNVDGTYIYKVGGKLVAFAKYQVAFMFDNQPVSGSSDGLTSAKALMLSRRIAANLSEELLPLCVDFEGRAQARVGPAIVAPVPKPAHAAKASPAARQAPETAPQIKHPAPSPAPAPTAEPTVEEQRIARKRLLMAELAALDGLPEEVIETPTEGGTKHDKLMEEFKSFGIDFEVQGGGKLSTHPFESTTTQESMGES